MVIVSNIHCRERTKYTPDKRGFDILSLKEVHRLGGWCSKSHPVVTMAGIDQILRGQDSRVVNAPSLHCQERTKYTPDKRGIEILSLKKVHRLAVGDRKHVALILCLE